MSKFINTKTLSRLSIFSLCLLVYAFLGAQDYAQGWEFFNKNNRKEATIAFKKALNNPKTANDAAIALIYLATFEGHESAARPLWQKASKNIDNPYAYMYTMWSNASSMEFNHCIVKVIDDASRGIWN
jgi:hypothetical protein